MTPAGTSNELDVQYKREENTHTHTVVVVVIPLLQYVARFDGVGEILGFERRGYKESRPWCSLFVGFLSLFVVPRGEKPALPMCWKGTSLSTISRVFVPIFFFGQSAVIDVEGVGFRPRAVVAGRGVVAVCTRISSQEYV